MNARIAIAVAALAGVTAGCGGSLPETIGVGNDQRLAPCPDSPNCLSSQTEDPAHRVEPLVIETDTDTDQAWEVAVRAVRQMERSTIVEHRPEQGYLHATFRSRLFRFVDDLELLLDRTDEVIHLRSASRLGYYDFGANRARIEALRASFRELQGAAGAARVRDAGGETDDGQVGTGAGRGRRAGDEPAPANKPESDRARRDEPAPANKPESDRARRDEPAPANKPEGDRAPA